MIAIDEIRIGFLDDEDDAIAILRNHFTRIPDLKCYFTTSPDEAYRWTREGIVNVLVYDLYLKGSTGIEHLRNARILNYDTKLILYTGNVLTRQNRDDLDEIEALAVQKFVGPFGLEAQIRASFPKAASEESTEKLVSENNRLKDMLIIACNGLIQDLNNNKDVFIIWDDREYSTDEMLREINAFTETGTNYMLSFLNAKKRI